MQKAMLAVPVLLSGLLLMKSWPPLSRLGVPTLGLLTGTGAAVALGGAITGTLLPQINATISPFSPRNIASLEMLVNALLILAGAVTSLVYFHFSARATPEGAVRRFAPLEMVALVGSIFVALTLGVLFAGIYSAALTALIERLHFLGAFFGLR
jgi:fucose permease